MHYITADHCFFLVDRTDRRLGGYISVLVEVFRQSRSGPTATASSDSVAPMREMSFDTMESRVSEPEEDAPTNWKQFLQDVAEAVSRPALLHEYHITPFSLGTAVSSGYNAQDVVTRLSAFAYQLPTQAMIAFITSHMERHNKASIVVDHNQRFHLCIRDESLADEILCDPRVLSLCVTRQRGLSDERLADEKWGDLHVVCSATSPPPGDEPVTPGGGGGGGLVHKEEISVLLQDHAASRLVADVLWTHHNLPICHVYDFTSPLPEEDGRGGGASSVQSINLVLRPQCKPRPYQVAAVEAALTHDGTAVRSGVLLLPCGAGKTLVGILLAAVVKKRTIIVCAGSISVEQWRLQLLESADLTPPSEGGGDSTVTKAGCVAPKTGAHRIACLTGKHKDAITDDTDVVITTYTMLGVAQEHHRREEQRRRNPDAATEEQDPATRAHQHPVPDRRSSAQSKRVANPKDALFDTIWGLMILDEVHMAPATGVRDSISHVVAKAVVGLTATYVREDHRIRDIFHVVGPKLFDISWEELHQQGYLASITCVEVHCPMTADFMVEYAHRVNMLLPPGAGGGGGGASALAAAPMLQAIAAANPNKMLCVCELVHRHLYHHDHDQSFSKILVFCDHIALLKEYAKLLDVPIVHGETSHAERMAIFSEFQSTRRVNVICISRVGDVSVNLPCANVVIQVSSHGGSRRQEAQRLGRILRPKQRHDSGPVEAYFYSLISRDTMEVSYAAHRSEFLVDQGYNCRFVVFDPPPPMEEEGMREDVPLATPQAVGSASAEGDAAHVKREAVMSDMTLRRRLVYGGSGPTGNSRAVGATTTVKDVTNRKWQLRLLASTVGRWELQYLRAKSTSKRNPKRRRQIATDDDGDESACSDAASVEIADGARTGGGLRSAAPPRPLQARSVGDIKREYGDVTTNRGAADAAQGFLLAQLTTSADGIVYHDLC